MGKIIKYHSPRAEVIFELKISHCYCERKNEGNAVTTDEIRDWKTEVLLNQLGPSDYNVQVDNAS